LVISETGNDVQRERERGERGEREAREKASGASQALRLKWFFRQFAR
jgi:hypothetical protein